MVGALENSVDLMKVVGRDNICWGLIENKVGLQAYRNINLLSINILKLTIIYQVYVIS